MLGDTTLNHFNAISSTWEEKGWVHSRKLNSNIHRFIKSTEKATGLNAKRDKSSLYFGIGTGVLFKYLRRYHVAGVDQAAHMLGRCPEGPIQILSDVNELPFLMNDQFNMTLSRNLLKHCAEPERAIQSMYHKLRPGGAAVILESVVLKAEDAEIPTRLVRMTDPTHPPFLAKEAIEVMVKKAGFKRIETGIMPYRSAWLHKWLRAEQARTAVHDDVLALYRDAPTGFRERHDVVVQNGNIISTVPWLFLRAIK